MSAQAFEGVLARLYTDEEFLRSFLEAPEGAVAPYELTEEELADLRAIDRAGLVMAARSFTTKREKRKKPALTPRAIWRRLFYGR